jgi:hypothetical protein
VTIVQKSPFEFAPIVSSIKPQTVVDTPNTTGEKTHRNLTFQTSTAAASHNDYLLEGINFGNGSVRGESTGIVDDSAFPIVRRSGGFTGSTRLYVDNGKAEIRTQSVFFGNTGGQVSNTSFAPVADTYAEYSRNRVIALCDALPDNKFLEMSGNNIVRANTGIIPHVKLTGIPIAGYNVPPTGAIRGKRFALVTPQHLIGCGHYGGSYVGSTIYFSDVNNNITSATVVSEVNLQQEYSGPDVALFRLNAAMPGTIAPLPVVGEWLHNIQSFALSGSFYCPQYYSMIFYGNEGLLAPISAWNQDYDLNTRPYPPDPLGLGITAQTSGFTYQSTSYWDLDGREDLSNKPGYKFAHILYAGDSGSPHLVPVANDGWALESAGGELGLLPAVINNMIALADTRAGSATGYTVTVAADPTL